MTGVAYVDGDVMPMDEARVPWDDRGHLLGDGVFETLRALNGAAMWPDRHRERFAAGIQTLGIKGALPMYDDALAKLLAAASEWPSARIRIQATRGRWSGFTEGGGSSVTGTAAPHVEPSSASVSLVTTPYVKPRGPLASVKSLSFLPHVMARRYAIAAGADDGILCNEAGRIAETSTANLFVRCGDNLHAPGVDEGALPGTVRAAVLEAWASSGVLVERLTPEELRQADEAWLTSSMLGVVPVDAIDGRRVASGSWTRRASRVYVDALEGLVRPGGHSGA